MNGIAFDVFNHGIIRYDLLAFYPALFIIDMIIYLILTKIFETDELNDKVVFYHQLPIIVFTFLGAWFPIFWYLSCLHLVAHFLVETIFLIHHKIYEYIVHHVYTILFLGPVVLFTKPYVCAMCLVPMMNNIIHHGSRVCDATDNTRTFRQIFFLLSRIIYPFIMGLFIPFISIPIGMKISLVFFAISIVLLMAPKIGSIQIQSDITDRIPAGFEEIGHRISIGYLDIVRWICSTDR